MIANDRAKPSMTDPLVQLGVRVPASLKRRLRLYAADHGLKGQWVVTEAIRDWLDKAESTKRHRP